MTHSLRSGLRTTRRARRGVSLMEILVAMTLLVFVLGSLSVLTTRTVRRSRDLDLSSARTFVVMQQANRFASIPYASIPLYASPSAPTIDTIVAGRFSYRREVSYTQGTTGAEYRTLKVRLIPLADTLHPDSLVFLRAQTYARSPLFQ